MPSRSEKQRRLMEAAAAGRTSRVPRKVAREFVKEDRKQARAERKKAARRRHGR